MKTTLEVRKRKGPSGADAPSANSRSGTGELRRKARRAAATKDRDQHASRARNYPPPRELMRRIVKVEKQVAAVREEVRSSLLAGAAAELRAVNAEQARAGLERLHASLLDMKERGITGERAEASYSQTAEDAV